MKKEKLITVNVKGRGVFVVGYFLLLFLAMAVVIYAGELYQSRERITVTSADGTALTEKSGMFRIGGVLDVNTYKAYIVFGAPSTSDSGVGGTLDSARLVLKTTLGDRRLTLDSIYKTVPCTLYSAKISALGDTLLGENLELDYYVRDTTSANMSWDYLISWWVVGR